MISAEMPSVFMSIGIWTRKENSSGCDSRSSYFTRRRRRSASTVGLQFDGFLRSNLEDELFTGARLERLDDPEDTHQKDRGEHRQAVDAHPAPKPNRQRRQHDSGILGIVDLGAVAHEAGRTHDAEGAGQAGAHHDHDQRTDDRQDDLRLHHLRRSLGRAPAARPQGECRPKQGRERKRDERVKIDLPRSKRLVMHGVERFGGQRIVRLICLRSRQGGRLRTHGGAGGYHRQQHEHEPCQDREQNRSGVAAHVR